MLLGKSNFILRTFLNDIEFTRILWSYRYLYSKNSINHKYYRREAALRPAAGSMIPEIFKPSIRGTANGIFSWGIYWGYGLTFAFGNYLAPLDLFG